MKDIGMSSLKILYDTKTLF